jgi:hypothetical protein
VGAAAAAIMITGFTSGAATTFGPSRPTFTWKDPASGITFDSITDNKTVGDERHFVYVRQSSTDTTAYSDQAAVNAGDEVIVSPKLVVRAGSRCAPSPPAQAFAAQ